jgi:hypothetical protein
MANEAAAAAKKIRKEHPELFQQEHTLARKITDSSLYDWNPQARFLLVQLAVLAMDDDSNYPEDAPDDFQMDKEGWCWMSQAKLSLKVGVHDSTVYRWIKQFREDGVILYRDWRDSNKTHHAEYKVVEKVIDAYQRPSQKEDVERVPRYKEGSRKGTTKNQQRGKGGTFMKVVEDEE